ncbi:MAG TPA: glutaminyl-peptide cyclotransferase [Pyrinomonadaceae bacterium]|nr:glutaminyl-peptide cyclotransferase [Pyrinomonadaceae bacterium]
MRLTAGLLLITLWLSGGGCRTGAGSNTAPANAPGPAATNGGPTAGPPARPPIYGYEVVNVFPHDPGSFTQGLIFHGGALIESAGQYGVSSLRRVELGTGKVLKKVAVPPQYFAEGLTLMGGRLYQLTWEHGKGFVYDVETFEKTGEFHYDGEGWGLTTDGQSLILSDGTSRLRFISPDDFRVTRAVNVADGGRPVRELNELEYVRGEVWANVWHDERIARIDPATGRVVGWVDLTGLLAPRERQSGEAVLNGIAYDAEADRLFVTGKLWPKLFEIRVKPR